MMNGEYEHLSLLPTTADIYAALNAEHACQGVDELPLPPPCHFLPIACPRQSLTICRLLYEIMMPLYYRRPTPIFNHQEGDRPG